MKKALFLAACGIAFATPATAEVKSQNDNGFVVGHTAEVLAKPDEVWKRLIQPKDWWNASHSWFGKAEGFYIDAQAGGCFCETEQKKGPDGQSSIGGSVEHMRVIFADPGKVLRMQGALGPLQSEAVLGTLTIAMEPLKDGAGTRLSFNYTVGGYMRFPMAKMATAVDGVIGGQFASLIKPMGKVLVGDAKADAKTDEWEIDPDKLEEKKPAEQSPAEKSNATPIKVIETKAPVDKPKLGKPEKVEPDMAKEPK